MYISRLKLRNWRNFNAINVRRGRRVTKTMRGFAQGNEKGLVEFTNTPPARPPKEPVGGTIDPAICGS